MIMPPVNFFSINFTSFLDKLATQKLFMKYLRGRLITAKYIIFSRAI